MAFTIRPLTPERSTIARNARLSLVNHVAIVSLCFVATLLLRSITPAAAEDLHFGNIPHVKIELPSRQTWQWSGAPEYKNIRIRYYQDALRTRGITKADDLKLLVSQLIQENGSFSTDVHGDNGCSVGLIQYNACVHHGMKAKRFLVRYPEWNSWEFQLDRMADMVAERYRIYDGNIKRVIVHHNSPVAARRNVDTKAGYFVSVKKRSTLLSI